jgi:hypothetical protein
LERIPRLEIIARMIEAQQEPVRAHISSVNLNSAEDVVVLGAQLLNLVLAFDDMTLRGFQTDIIMSTLRQRVNSYNPYLLDILETIKRNAVEQGFIEELTVDELHIGMIVMQDVWSNNELLLVPRGQEITHSVLIRLRKFAQRVGVLEPIRVRQATQDQ